MKRWWGIRHGRYCWLRWRAHRHYRVMQSWGAHGLGMELFRQNDHHLLQAIWEGKR